MPRARITKPTAWDSAVSRFMTHLENAEHSAHTTHHYRDDLMAFKKWRDDKDLTPADITDEVLRQWKSHLREEVLTEKNGRVYKRKASTINTKLAALRSFLRWAQRAKVIALAPELPRRERSGRHPLKSLDKDQQNRLLRTAADSHAARDHPLIVILLHLALRVAELTALVWSDVQLTDRKGWFTVRDGKGRKPRGPFAMSPDAVRAFKTLRKLDPAAGPGDRIFRSQRGDDGQAARKTPLSIRGVQNMVGRLAKRAGIPGLSPHWLRHTCALNMAERLKNNPRCWPIIRDFMGHSSVKTTLDHYATTSDRDIEEAVGADFDDE